MCVRIVWDYGLIYIMRIQCIKNSFWMGHTYYCVTITVQKKEDFQMVVGFTKLP